MNGTVKFFKNKSGGGKRKSEKKNPRTFNVYVILSNMIWHP